MEYLKDLERMAPGDALPPVNVGPYDNPLLWNMMDPYGADRGHQRRPMSVSRNTMELYNVPMVHRDHCVHRWIPFEQCSRHLKPVIYSNLNCHEFEHAWVMCRTFETYRFELLKNKFIEMTKNYTSEDKKFFPSKMHIHQPTYWSGPFSTMVASMRTSGWDERDPKFPLMGKEPNRALMRTEFTPTLIEEKTAYLALGAKLMQQEVLESEVPGFPLPESKRPKPDFVKSG